MLSCLALCCDTSLHKLFIIVAAILATGFDTGINEVEVILFLHCSGRQINPYKKLRLRLLSGSLCLMKMDFMHNTRTSFLRLLLIAAAVSVSAACVSTNSNSTSVLSADSIAAMPLLPASSFSVLALANSGDQLQLTESPWGNPVQATVRDRYISASNRLCLALDLALAQRSETALVCQNEAQQWYQSRALAF
ncbi:common-antigen outer membrane protein [Alkalimonas amylolytica]|uniref:Common-antigen outer membrane protein n=2 Tax=Alkalimonas amylolytica TaxID=152573 RepID=A0A1H4A2M4_ALKAM|nr:common-antigen outer membrane protein [Alkalimonas amylolytica]